MTEIKKVSKKRLIGVVCVSITLLLILMWFVGIESIVEVVRSADPRYFALALTVEPFILLVRAHRWRLIVSRLGHDELGLKKASLLYMTGLYGGSFTPSKVGDLLRAYLLTKDTNARVPAGKAVFSIVLDRVLDVISLITIVLVGVPLFFVESIASFQYILLMGVVTAGLLVGLSLLLFSERYGERLINLAAKPVLKVIGGVFKEEKQHNTASKLFDQFSESVSTFRNKKAFLAGVYFYSLAIWLSTCGQAYLVLAALEPNLPNFLHFATIFPLSMFAALIPVTISGLGTREAAMVVIMSIIGINAVTAFVLSITFAFVSLWLPAIGGGIYVALRSIKMESK